MISIKEVISSLLDQAQDKETMVPPDEPDSIFAHDAAMLREAVRLLKAQEPSLLDIGDILTSHQVDVYLENRSDKKVFPITLLNTENTVKSQTAYFFPMMVMPIKGYGKTWRCWTSRPTDEQREAVKWE